MGISSHALTESNRLFTYARPPPLAGSFSLLFLIFLPAFIASFLCLVFLAFAMAFLLACLFALLYYYGLFGIITMLIVIISTFFISISLCSFPFSVLPRHHHRHLCIPNTPSSFRFSPSPFCLTIIFISPSPSSLPSSLHPEHSLSFPISISSFVHSPFHPPQPPTQIPTPNPQGTSAGVNMAIYQGITHPWPVYCRSAELRFTYGSRLSYSSAKVPRDISETLTGL